MSSDNKQGRLDKDAVYSRLWAQEVLGRYQDCHPRATDILCESLQISRDQLSNYIRFNDPLWTPLREVGKWAEKHLATLYGPAQWFQQLDPSDQHTFVKWLKTCFEEKNAYRIVKRLDSLWFVTDNLIRSDSRGGESTSERSDDDASSSPLGS